jgi:hypothetical protein
MQATLRHLFSAGIFLTMSASCASALTLGLPIFTTTPGDIHLLNQFQDSVPSSEYTLSLLSTIASAQGAPGLVGKTINFEITIESISGFSRDARLSIDGVDLNAFAGAFGRGDTVSLSLPISSSVYDPATDKTTDSFAGIFSSFGPVTYGVGSYSDVFLQYVLSTTVLPQTVVYEYCQTAHPSICELSKDPNLTEIGGEPVDLGLEFSGPEGTLRGATMTFSTVNGRPVPSPVPLPAGGLLLAAALSALGLGSAFHKKRVAV